jgi:hypothetical protein
MADRTGLLIMGGTKMVKTLVHEMRDGRTFESTDDGKSWQERIDKIISHEVDGRIYISRNDGRTWETKKTTGDKINSGIKVAGDSAVKVGGKIVKWIMTPNKNQKRKSYNNPLNNPFGNEIEYEEEPRRCAPSKQSKQKRTTSSGGTSRNEIDNGPDFGDPFEYKSFQSPRW